MIPKVLLTSSRLSVPTIPILGERPVVPVGRALTVVEIPRLSCDGAGVLVRRYRYTCVRGVGSGRIVVSFMVPGQSREVLAWVYTLDIIYIGCTMNSAFRRTD